MLAHLRPAIALLALFTLMTGIAYPLTVTLVAQFVMPVSANGSMISRGGTVVGSELIGQAFRDDRYFHGRPSAAGANGYDAANSSGSNLGPLSRKLLDRVTRDVASLRRDSGALIPADAVSASASGLDPHISPAFALLQAARVARARNATEPQIRALVEAAVEQPLADIVGEPRVNVLKLNLALDAALPGSAG